MTFIDVNAIIAIYLAGNCGYHGRLSHCEGGNLVARTN